MNDSTLMTIIGACIGCGIMGFIGIMIFLSVLENNGVDTTLLTNQILVCVVVVLSIPLIILAIKNRASQKFTGVSK